MSTKRRHAASNENDPFVVFTPDTPHAKRRRRTFPDTADPAFIECHKKLQEERAEREKRAKEEQEVKDAEETARKLKATLTLVQEQGYTLHDWLAELFMTKDPHISSQVTKLIEKHGREHLDAMLARSPEVVTQWVTDQTSDSLDQGTEGWWQTPKDSALNVAHIAALANRKLIKLSQDTPLTIPTASVQIRMRTSPRQSFSSSSRFRFSPILAW